MKKLNKVKQPRGVGEFLSGSLVEAVYDTVAKVAATGEDGLAKVPGINRRMIPAILEQAGQLAGEGRSNKAQKTEELKQRVAGLKELGAGDRAKGQGELPGGDRRKEWKNRWENRS